MKKIMITIITIISVIILICTAAGTMLFMSLHSQENLRHYFDDWESETPEDIVQVLHSGYSLYYNSEKLKLNLRDGIIEGGIVDEVYCIRNGRIYFSYSTRIQNSYPHKLWKIASVGIDGNDLKEHYSGDLFSTTEYNGNLEMLSYCSNRNEHYGGLYENGRIYLRGYDKTIVYDIDSDSVEEVTELPVSQYTWNIENAQKLIIQDTEQNLTRTITLASMAANNEYAKKLLELSEKMTWSGDSFLERFFVSVKLVNDDIYIIGQVFNFHGEAFAVVFKYGYSSDSVQYVTSIMVNDLVSGNYCLASSH